MTTPKYPVMDDAFIDFYYFYCPNRILWDNFKQFMGEIENTPWMPTKEYSVPQITIAGRHINRSAKPVGRKHLDYMGVPTKVKAQFSVNALPIRAYVMIWNEFFRDENVDNAAVFKRDDSNVIYADSKNDKDIEKVLKEAICGGRCLPVNRFHDYFSSCLPYPQRGPSVSVPIEGNAAVKLYNDIELSGELAGADVIKLYQNGEIYNTTETTGKRPAIVAQSGIQGAKTAYIGTDLASVTATTINDLRKAVAVQQYYEALARGGSRYREQVQALWNVTISDKTVQVPEYLGGGRYRVNMNQIVQTSGQQTSTDTPIGETGAMSVTPVNESSFTKSFEEHGFVIGVCCVRHNHSYQQGLERFWSRKDRLDYYVPQFANLGEQPVKKKEIMLTGTDSDEETFGYQEAWADYRMKPNRVSGLMRSNATGTLDFWHYADNYDKVPTLSQEWMAEGKTEIARTLIVQDEPQFFGAIRVANKTTRRMPLYSVPGLYKL